MATLEIQNAAGNDQCFRRLNPSGFITNALYHYIGSTGATADQQGAGLRFLNIAIPQGAIITTAYLMCKCGFVDDDDNCNSRISAEDTDDPGDFSGDDGASIDIRFGNHTFARIDWDAIAHWVLNTWYNSPEIKTVIQELVNRGDWNGGDACVLFFEDFDDRSTPGARRLPYGRGTSAPKLHIEYELAAVGRSHGYIIG